MDKITLPCHIEADSNGDFRLVYELAFALETGENLPGTDCPGETCSVCGELVEQGVRFCSNCGRRFIRNA